MKGRKSHSGIKWVDGNSTSTDKDLMRLENGDVNIGAELEHLRTTEVGQKDGSASGDEGSKGRN